MADNDSPVSGPNNPGEDKLAAPVADNSVAPETAVSEKRVMAATVGPNNPQEDVEQA